jgi:hypothetical protein
MVFVCLFVCLFFSMLCNAGLVLAVTVNEAEPPFGLLYFVGRRGRFFRAGPRSTRGFAAEPRGGANLVSLGSGNFELEFLELGNLLLLQKPKHMSRHETYVTSMTTAAWIIQDITAPMVEAEENFL